MNAVSPAFYDELIRISSGGLYSASEPSSPEYSPQLCSSNGSWWSIYSYVKNCGLDSPQGAGGPNVVAIDNKIEQAMDLVKTHLMYAVREEVEVLRGRIGELEKKVGQLEKENALLREHASPELLGQLAALAVAPSAPVSAPSSAQ